MSILQNALSFYWPYLDTHDIFSLKNYINVQHFHIFGINGWSDRNGRSSQAQFWSCEIVKCIEGISVRIKTPRNCCPWLHGIPATTSVHTNVFCCSRFWMTIKSILVDLTEIGFFVWSKQGMTFMLFPRLKKFGVLQILPT